MPSEAISTVVKMLESLPEYAQNQALDHLRDYLADRQDELQWDDLLKGTNGVLEPAFAVGGGHRAPISQRDWLHRQKLGFPK